MGELELDDRLPPHLDGARWDRLLDSVGPESILVVIGSWLGAGLRRHVAAEDIWQETLFHAWRDREKHVWQGVKAYRGWLLAIAKNRIHDAVDRVATLKRGADQGAVNFSELVPGRVASLSAVLPGSSATPTRIASCQERAELMEQALAALNAEERGVVRLYLFEELAMEAVAAQLGLSTSAAWRRFRKGTAACARRLVELGTLT